jgi:hypothetical protein
VPWSRKRGSIHPLTYTPSWCITYLVKYRDNFALTENSGKIAVTEVAPVAKAAALINKE